MTEKIVGDFVGQIVGCIQKGAIFSEKSLKIAPFCISERASDSVIRVFESLRPSQSMSYPNT